MSVFDEAALARARELVREFKDRPLEGRGGWEANGYAYVRDLRRGKTVVIAPTAAGTDLRLDPAELGLLKEAPALLAALIERLEFHEPPRHDCRTCEMEWLETLHPNDSRRWRGLFLVCETCGNKRCPHATDHRLDCSGSNEPGQAGSAYA